VRDDALDDLPSSPACDRNKGPILDVLLAQFADRRRVFEIGSGTGEHAVHFALHMPGTHWQCSEISEHLTTLTERLRRASLANLPPPVLFDVRNLPRPLPQADAIFTANTLHILCWQDVATLFDCASRVLRAPGARLAVYGPFRHKGAFTSYRDEEFDRSLRARDPLSGLRDVEQVDRLAVRHGMRLLKDCAMPANNRTLIWVR
jgi:SAM-dependent methyltransferase